MDLDEILSNIGLGSYQITVCGLMGLMIMYSSISPLSYVITASDLKYRCKIPECDTDNLYYNTDWLNQAIPFNEKSNEPYKCLMYHYVSPTSNGTDISANSTCKEGSFNVNSKKKCNKWVFSETERTIVNDFGIMCEENKWKLNMVGTINSIGQIIGIPLAGYISDMSGRKYVAIIGSVASVILGTLKSFTVNYYSFLLFEFLESMASSGVYGVTFVLGIELVSPKSRTAVSTLMGCFYPIGAVLMGFIAYMILDWRIMLRVVNLPGLLILGYIWYVPESLRWLQTQNRFKEMAIILSKIAESNGNILPSCVEEILISDSTNTLNQNKMSGRKLIRKIFSSKNILLLVFNCSFCWMTITLVYYGLSLTSVELSGNKYLNFMLVNIVEVPAFLTSWYFMEHFSRRYTQAFSLFLSGVGCLMVNLISMDYSWMILLLFLSSKYTITIAFNNMYMFTAEVFPTELRTSLMSIVSMFGRLGVLLAPQIMLLSAYFGQYIPIFLFGILSTIAGAMAFLLPETKDQKLTNTLGPDELVREV